jgi:hypothetical protein
MQAHRSLKQLGLVAVALAAPAPAFAGGDAPAGFPGTVVFSGSDYKEDVSFSYVGAVHALNGSLDKNGFLVRVFAGFGEYQYATEGVPEGHVETDLTIVDAGVGYQVYAGAVRLSAYAQASYEEHDQSPEDTANSARGDAWGFKANLEAETTADAPIYAGVIGSYSTAFDSYWVRGRAGMRVGHGIVIGPEIIALGNEEFDQMRYGAFVSGLPSIFSLMFGGDSKSSLAIGYADTDEDGGSARAGDDSIYGSIGTSFSF